MSLVRRYLPLVAAGLLVGAGLGLLIILGFGVGSDLIARLVRARSAGEPALVPEVSSPAPAFDLQTPQGTKVSLSDQRGRPVLVNFWATWCPPCRSELPELIYLKGAHANLEVIGVAILYRNKREVEESAREQKITYRVVPGDEDTASVFGGVDELPTSFLFSPDGKMVKEWRGPLSREEVERAMGKSE